MDHSFLIDLPNRGEYYEFFTFSGYWVSFLIMMWLGGRRKFPFVPLLAIILVGRIGFLVGSQLGSIPAESWSLLFREGIWPFSPARSLWGGILLAIVSIEITRRWLTFGHPIYGLYAIAVPFGLAVQRLGCLAAGCCFGNTTTVPFAVQFGAGTPVFQHHLESGWIDSLAGHSLAVYPVPVLLMVVYLLTGIVMAGWGQRFRTQGVQLAVALGMLSAGRFFVEFFRDPASNAGLQGEYFGHLKLIQWVVLGIGISALLFAVYGQKQAVPAPTARPTKVAGGRWLVLSATVLTVLIAFRHYFSPLDIWALIMIAAWGGITIGLQSLLTIRLPHLQWLTPVLVLAVPVLMAQDTIQRTYKEKLLAEKDSLPGITGAIEFGGTFGSYKSVSHSCDGSVTSRLNTNYQTGGLVYRQMYNLKGFTRAEFALYGGVGRERVDGVRFLGQTQPVTVDETSIVRAVGFSGLYETRWFGLGTGYVWGNVNYETNINVYARIGPYDAVYLEGGTLTSFPMLLNEYQIQIGLGTGLGTVNGSRFGMGAMIHDQFPAFYMMGKGKIGDHLLLGGTAVFSGSDEARGLQLNLSYLFPIRE